MPGGHEDRLDAHESEAAPTILDRRSETNVLPDVFCNLYFVI